MQTTLLKIVHLKNNYMRPRLTLLLTVLIISLHGFAQKKSSAIGFSFNLTDFQTPTDIKNTSLHDVLKSGDWHQGARLDPSFSLVYWKGLTRHIDVSARYNGIFGSNTLSNLTNKSGLQDYY